MQGCQGCRRETTLNRVALLPERFGEMKGISAPSAGKWGRGAFLPQAPCQQTDHLKGPERIEPLRSWFPPQALHHKEALHLLKSRCRCPVELCRIICGGVDGTLANRRHDGIESSNRMRGRVGGPLHILGLQGWGGGGVGRRMGHMLP